MLLPPSASGGNLPVPRSTGGVALGQLDEVCLTEDAGLVRLRLGLLRLLDCLKRGWLLP